MIRFPLYAALLLPSVAFAQPVDAPLVIEAGAPVPLSKAAPPDRAMAGDAYLVAFSVLNRSSEPVRLRRITLRVPSGLDLVDPNIDGIDNDRDGAVDEGDEGFSRVDRDVSAWRIDEAAAPVPPGQSAEYAVTIRLPQSSEAGATLGLSVSAAGTAADITMRAEHEAQFSLAAPELSLMLGDTDQPQVWSAQDSPDVRAVVTILSGQISDLGLALKGSPSVEDYAQAQIRFGDGIICDGSPEPIVEGRTLSAKLGTCRVDSDVASADRFVALEAKVQFRDAEPFSDPEIIDARRNVRIAAEVTREGEAVSEPVTVSGRLSGPLVGARLLSVSDDAVDAGDPVRARYRIVNRGDGEASRLRLYLQNDGVFDCEAMALDDSKTGVDACRDGLSLQRLKARSSRDVTLTAGLRDDALLESGAALRLTARADGMAEAELPPAALILRLPDPPALSLGGGGEWESTGEILTARIGDVGKLRLSGALPEGRTAASLRLLSRLVDAQTGEPVGPANLRVEAFAATPSDGVSFSKKTADSVPSVEDGWSVARLPLGIVTAPIAEGGDGPGYSAEAVVSLRDSPAIKAGRLIELAADLTVFGDTDRRGDDWLEILVVEPSLTLTVRSPDQDRIIGLHETVDVAVLSCNRGTSSAEAVLLTATLPESLELTTQDRAWLRTVDPSRSDDTAALFSADARRAGEVYFDAGQRVLRGELSDNRALPPDTCLAMVFQVKRSNSLVSPEPIAVIAAGVEPFTGRDGAQARIYSGLDAGAIRFELPSVSFGPVSTREIQINRTVEHELSLEIPASAGPHRLDLSIESSAGLDWTILRLGEDEAPQPWRNGSAIAAGEIVRFRFEAPNPGTPPLGWVDTTLVRALAFSETGTPIAASSRLLTRRGQPEGGRISVTKTMALDRDCDGEIGDERVQDALFEPVKDASPGDCVIFRVAFRHAGDNEVESIVVRDKVPAGTDLLPNAVEVLRTPEPLQRSDLVKPEGETRDMVWTFDGLFKPGTEGEVSYAVKLLERRE